MLCWVFAITATSLLVGSLRYWELGMVEITGKTILGILALMAIPVITYLVIKRIKIPGEPIIDVFIIASFISIVLQTSTVIMELITKTYNNINQLMSLDDAQSTFAVSTVITLVIAILLQNVRLRQKLKKASANGRN